MVSEKVLRINVERKFLYREIFAILILIEGAQRDNLNGKNKEAQVQLVKKKPKPNISTKDKSLRPPLLLMIHIHKSVSTMGV